MRLFTSKGFSLPEALLSLAALSFTALLVASLAKWQQQNNSKALTNEALSALRDAMLANIANQESWDKTKSKNPKMACSLSYPSTCTSTDLQEIALYKSDGSLLFDTDTQVPNNGFTENGTPCSSYSPQGNFKCPIHVKVQWQILCQGVSSCKYPEELISVTFDYSSDAADKKIINISKYNIRSFSRTNFSENNSPVVTCLKKGNYVFIGFEKTVSNGDGLKTTADSDGCVDINAFKGPTGDQGPQGPSGPPGPGGSAGGVDSSPGGGQLAQSESEKACAGYPDICALYKKYFNRLPDVVGAEYWNSVLAWNGGDISKIDKEFAWRSEGNIISYKDASGKEIDKDQVWNNIAQKYGLNGSSEECSSASTCTGVNPQAVQEWSDYLDSFCSTQGNSCDVVHTDNPG